MSKILVGSTYFFNNYNDFASKDIDEVELIETNEFQHFRQLTGKGKCLFQLKIQKTKKDYFDSALKFKTGMAIGKFLVPEFCEIIGMTINDLPYLYPLIEVLDDKHKYEEIIYNAYLQNGSFTLTQEQRDAAYLSYKQSRNLT